MRARLLVGGHPNGTTTTSPAPPRTAAEDGSPGLPPPPCLAHATTPRGGGGGNGLGAVTDGEGAALATAWAVARRTTADAAPAGGGGVRGRPGAVDAWCARRPQRRVVRGRGGPAPPPSAPTCAPPTGTVRRHLPPAPSSWCLPPPTSPRGYAPRARSPHTFRFQSARGGYRLREARPPPTERKGWL